MRTSHRPAVHKLIVVGDGVAIVLSVGLAFVLHGQLREWVSLLKAPPRFQDYALLLFLTAPMWLSFAPLFELHLMFDRVWERRRLLLALLKLHGLGLLALAIVLFLTQMVFNRSLVALFLACTFVLMYAEREIIQLRLRYRQKLGHARSRVLLIGDAGKDMAEFVQTALHSKLPPRFVGRLAPADEVGVHSGTWPGPDRPQDLGDVAHLEHLLHEQPVDEALFFPPCNQPEHMKRALEICETLGVPAYFWIDVSQPSESVPSFASLNGRPFVLFDIAPKPAVALAIKHTLDTIAAALGMLLLSPLLLLLAMAILLSMGRPVFFAQRRAGLYGREFHMLKFRTMVHEAEGQRDLLWDANQMGGPVFKLADDPRVTRVGWFLRRWSLDELPQLFNVLVGTMSLVGPRPLPIEEQRQIKGWRRRRLSMRPGITGLWQVSGRSDVDFEEWMKLDLRYVDEWSLGSDFRILWRTVGAVIAGRGAR